MLRFTLILFLLSSVTAFNSVRFSSIQQCGPFNVTFSGTQPTALPLTLTVVPFASSAVPLSIPLPKPEWNSEMSTGVAITFLPYPAGTTFVASLDDANGRGTGSTSDIIRIMQSDNTSCISTTQQTQTYTPEPPFSQCQPFDVTFDPTKSVPPVVRSFTPNGPALFLNQTRLSTNPPGTSSFTMAAFRGQPVILLFSDGSNRLQSTNLLTVTGDATSSNSCFPIPPGGPPQKPKETGLSRQAVIGIVASIASVVTLLSVLVAVHFFLRFRRSSRIHKAMQQKGIEGGPGSVKPDDTPHPQSARSSWDVIKIINKPTPYPMEKYTSRPLSPYFVQSTSNHYVPGSYRQMQTLNAATADLDQILNASVFTSNGGDRVSSSSLSPSTTHSRDIPNSGSSIGVTEQPKAVSPVSPLSFTSNFRDLIIPVSFVREGCTEADSGTGGGCKAARRSSIPVIISGQNAMDCGGQDGHGDQNL